MGEIVDQKAYFKLHWGGRSNCAKLSQNNLVHTTASRSFFDWNLSRDFMSIKHFRWDHWGQSKKWSFTFSKGYRICRAENIGRLKENIMFCPDVRRYRYIACTKRVAVTFLENFEWPLKIMTASTLIHFSHLVNFTRWIFVNGWTDYLPLFHKISECWSSIEKKIKD